MPVVIYRQPWFWAVIIAVAAVLGFVVVIAASNRDRTAENSTTILQQPSPNPAPNPAIVPVPGGTNTPPPPPVQPAEPERPERPEEPANQPAPQVKERVIVKERPVPVPVPVPSREPAPTPAPGTTPPGPGGTSGAGDEFQNTGLQRQLSFNGAQWRASSTVRMEESQLRSAGVSDNSTELFVETNAREPFTVVYVPIPDQEGMYVRYNRR